MMVRCYGSMTTWRTMRRRQRCRMMASTVCNRRPAVSLCQSAITASRRNGLNGPAVNRFSYRGRNIARMIPSMSRFRQISSICRSNPPRSKPTTRLANRQPIRRQPVSQVRRAVSAASGTTRLEIARCPALLLAARVALARVPLASRQEPWTVARLEVCGRFSVAGASRRRVARGTAPIMATMAHAATTGIPASPARVA